MGSSGLRFCEGSEVVAKANKSRARSKRWCFGEPAYFVRGPRPIVFGIRSFFPAARTFYPTGEGNAFSQRLNQFANPPDGKPLPDSGNRMAKDLSPAIFPSSPRSFASGLPIFHSTARPNSFPNSAPGVHCQTLIFGLGGTP